MIQDIESWLGPGTVEGGHCSSFIMVTMATDELAAKLASAWRKIMGDGVSVKDRTVMYFPPVCKCIRYVGGDKWYSNGCTVPGHNEQ